MSDLPIALADNSRVEQDPLLVAAYISSFLTYVGVGCMVLGLWFGSQLMSWCIAASFREVG
jgi:hypothetical protein